MVPGEPPGGATHDGRRRPSGPRAPRPPGRADPRGERIPVGGPLHARTHERQEVVHASVRRGRADGRTCHRQSHRIAIGRLRRGRPRLPCARMARACRARCRHGFSGGPGRGSPARIPGGSRNSRVDRLRGDRTVRRDLGRRDRLRVGSRRRGGQRRRPDREDSRCRARDRKRRQR